MSVIYSNRPNGDYVLTPFLRLVKTSLRTQIATPYFTKAEHLCEEAKKGKIIQLLIGLNEATNPNALQEIFGAPNVSIRYFTSRFHAKIFIFDQSALLGSANLTDGGLHLNREAVIELDSETDPDTFKNLRILFDELWEMGDVLTLEKLELFKETHLQMRTNKQNYEGVIEKKLGRTQPRNANVVSRNNSKTHTFLEKLRQEIHEQYIPAFDTITKIIEARDHIPHDLGNLNIRFVTNRFLNYLKMTHAKGNKFLSRPAPLQPIEVQHKLIEDYYEEWINHKDGKIPADYKERLDNIEQTFGSKKKIMAADKDQIMNGLLSLHTLSNRHNRMPSLPEDFWEKNKLSHVQSSLSELLHGEKEFVIRFHDYLYDQTKKLYGFGYFSALELLGTVTPDICPPINSRMAKSLRFLGFDVKKTE